MSGKDRLIVVDNGRDRFEEDLLPISGKIEEILEDDNEARGPHKVDQRVDSVEPVDRIDLPFFDRMQRSDARRLTSCTFRESICSLFCWPMANDVSKTLQPLSSMRN